MPVRDTGGAQTGREEWFQPLQPRWKVPGWDVLAGRAAGQVLARRPSVGPVPPVLPQRRGAVENTLAACAHVPCIPAQLWAWAVGASSRHTSRVEDWAGCVAWTGDMFGPVQGHRYKLHGNSSYTSLVPDPVQWTGFMM